MQKWKNLFFGVIVIFTSMITTVSAANPRTYTFLNDDQEIFLEIVNVIIALFGAYLAIRTMNLVKGSQLEVGVKYLVLAAITFAILEIYALLKTYIISISGLGDVIELITVTFLLLGFFNMYKSLK